MQIKKTPKGYLALCKDVPTTLESHWFTPSFWQQQDAIVGTSTGRYTTWFVEYKHQQWVLRHYYRGGFIARISNDSYIFTGLERTRAISELRLLEKLEAEGFPVPKPIGANIIKRGCFYQADILIERIEGAEDLLARLTRTPLSPDLWHRLGVVLSTFHERGVFHADLNLKNILITADKFYLIDFDRGCIRPPNSRWQQANLNRLKRSFNKQKNNYPSLAFSDDDWQKLLEGYHSSLSTSS